MTPLRRAQRTAQPRGPVLPPNYRAPPPRDRCSTRSPERPPPPRISVRTALSRPPGGRQRQSRRQQDVLRMIHDRPVVTVKDITKHLGLRDVDDGVDAARHQLGDEGVLVDERAAGGVDQGRAVAQ